MTHAARLSGLVFCIFIIVCPHAPAWSQLCASPDSDTDNDGWGWENESSCIVRSAPLPATPPATPTAIPTESDCIDTDGDGWGWNGSSCRVPATNDIQTLQPAPATDDPCIDTDGDGWGWKQRQQQSCRVQHTADTTYNNSAGQPAVQNPGLTAPQLVAPPATPIPYPARNPFHIKALYTDFWRNKKQLLDANIEGVSINFVWAHWEATNTRAPCAANMIRYANRCYKVADATDEEVRYWSGQGKNITAIVWGVPEWARDQHCISSLPGRAIFCSVKDTNRFGDFSGMLANRYRSANGKGLINDFVIHNEVNMYEWYNHRCSDGQNCQLQSWLDNYADSYNTAYDRIKQENPAARVFAPFAHQFAAEFDNLRADRPLISVQTFVRGLNQRAGNRDWKIAYHPYNKGLHVNGFSTNDWPHVTVGNIGVLAGWLRSEFPLQSESWEVYLTESGYNSVSPHATEQGQAEDLCRSFYNVLATPGIENYVYHRMRDHTVELEAGVGLGLHNANGSAKQSWTVWAGASGRHGNRNQLSCGFENLPYTKITRYSHPTLPSRTSSRLVNDEYNRGATWWLMRNHIEDAAMLHECPFAKGSYLTSDASCNGTQSLGPVGYAHRKYRSGRRSLYSCQSDSGIRFTTDNAYCDDKGSPIEFLGYSAGITR